MVRLCQEKASAAAHVDSEPPILAIAPGDRDDGTPRDTARNTRLNHGFVVNLVDEPLAEAMNRTAATLPYGISELTAAGLTTLSRRGADGALHRPSLPVQSFCEPSMRSGLPMSLPSRTTM